MYYVKIDAENCKSCLYCLNACKKDVLGIAESSNSKGYRYIEVKHQENCVGFKMCAIMCPDAVVEVYKED